MSAENRARLTSAEVYLPRTQRTTRETEQRLRAENPGLLLPTGLIRRMTGVKRVFVRDEGEQASDLAVKAAQKVLAENDGDPDLLIFASASQDMVEPATSHMVAHKLGLPHVPVMDVKNACNSVVNAMQVAQALIATGQAKRVLIASGETPNTAVRWKLRYRRDFLRAFPGYTMSDSGAALMLEAGDAHDASGIDGMYFTAANQHWDVGTLPGGGSAFPRDTDKSYFDMDGTALAEAFLDLGPAPVDEHLARVGNSLDDYDLIAMHQVALPHLPRIAKRLGISTDRIVQTIDMYGNLASVTLPLQLRLALDSGQIRRGSKALLVGLAGGISVGLVSLTL